mgnify:CR=1 FL=1
MDSILITGAAGFIGSTLAHRLMARGDEVIGVDNLNDYDQVSLYFVKPGYTMENTAYYVTTLNYASQTSVTLPAGEYTMYVVHKDNNNNKILLAQTELTKLISGSNYLLVAEKEQNSLSGFKLTLAK